MRIFRLLCTGLLVAFINACGATDGSGLTVVPTGDQSVAEALRELEQLPAPEGIAPADWQQLKGTLAAMLSASGKSRFVSAIAPPQKSAVSDFAAAGDTTSATFSWTYRNDADYDQNGEVNVADLTPLGGSLGSTSDSADWPSAQLADGDGNGEVNISDITPIGASFKNSVNGYRLEHSPDQSEGSWTLVEQVATSAGAVPDGGGRKTFEHSIDGAAEGFYRVTTYAGEEIGTSSNAVQLGSGVEPFNWNLNIANVSITSCAALPDGTLYVCGARDPAATAADQRYAFAACLSNTGTLLWSREYIHVSHPAGDRTDVLPNSLIIGPNGNLWLACTRSVYTYDAEWDLFNFLRADALILELAQDGTQVSQRLFEMPVPTEYESALNGIDSASANSMYLAGRILKKGPTVFEDVNAAWLLHLQDDYTPIVSRKLETAEHSIFVDVATQASDLYAVGSWNEVGEFDSELLITRIDAASGALLAQKAIGVDGPSESIKSVHPAADGGLLFGGHILNVPVNYLLYGKFDADLGLSFAYMRTNSGDVALLTGGDLLAATFNADNDPSLGIINGDGSLGAAQAMLAPEGFGFFSDVLEVQDGVYAFCGENFTDFEAWSDVTPEPVTDYETTMAALDADPFLQFDPAGAWVETGGSLIEAGGSWQDFTTSPFGFGSFVGQTSRQPGG